MEPSRPAAMGSLLLVRGPNQSAPHPCRAELEPFPLLGGEESPGGEAGPRRDERSEGPSIEGGARTDGYVAAPTLHETLQDDVGRAREGALNGAGVGVRGVEPPMVGSREASPGFCNTPVKRPARASETREEAGAVPLLRGLCLPVSKKIHTVTADRTARLSSELTELGAEGLGGRQRTPGKRPVRGTEGEQGAKPPADSPGAEPPAGGLRPPPLEVDGSGGVESGASVTGKRPVLLRGALGRHPKRAKPPELVSARLDESGVSYQHIRTAIDWARLLFAHEPTLERLADLWPAPHEDRPTRAIETCSTRIELNARAMGDTLVLSRKEAGVRIVIRRPSSVEIDPVQQQQQTYRVEVDIQGTLLSGSKSGWDVLSDVRAAVEALVYGDQAETPEELRAILAPRTFAGRFDIAFDCAVQGDDGRADEWIEHGIYRGGHLDEARASWSSRSRSRKGVARIDGEDPKGDESGEEELKPIKDEDKTRLLGTYAKGRTLYFGSPELLMLRVYERDKLEHGDWEILKETLLGCGWNSKDRLIRAEFVIQRAWLRDQRIGGTRGDQLTLDEYLEALPSIAEQLVERYRHTLGGTTRVRRADTSKWWRTVTTEGTKRMREASGWDSVREVMSHQRSKRIDRAIRDGAHAAAALVALGRVSTFAEAFCLFSATIHDPSLADHFAEYEGRIRRSWELDPDAEGKGKVAGVGT